MLQRTLGGQGRRVQECTRVLRGRKEDETKVMEWIPRSNQFEYRPPREADRELYVESVTITATDGS